MNMATIINAATANGSSAPVDWTGGTGTFWAWGNFGGATVALEASPDGTNWIGVGPAVSFTQNGVGGFSLGPCRLRATVSGATATTSVSASA
ncbi:MAG: hypothetical protein P4L72_03330 [Parvibaculum sp.]|uniref:hypothetical protein n=1 Tax=Parvibaculum sp. TaxID=2024848 RepID=UPI0028403712|nr:hypothetical protein [Parvibaculum sp.]MDR3498241.1 hypothetical protein [Parvibaculum sp.]